MKNLLVKGYRDGGDASVPSTHPHRPRPYETSRLPGRGRRKRPLHTSAPPPPLRDEQATGTGAFSPHVRTAPAPTEIQEGWGW
jgi:hypothetical protein